MLSPDVMKSIGRCIPNISKNSPFFVADSRTISWDRHRWSVRFQGGPFYLKTHTDWGIYPPKWLCSWQNEVLNLAGFRGNIFSDTPTYQIVGVIYIWYVYIPLIIFPLYPIAITYQAVPKIFLYKLGKLRPWPSPGLHDTEDTADSLGDHDDDNHHHHHHHRHRRHRRHRHHHHLHHDHGGDGELFWKAEGLNLRIGGEEALPCAGWKCEPSKHSSTRGLDRFFLEQSHFQR